MIEAFVPNLIKGLRYAKKRIFSLVALIKIFVYLMSNR